MKILLTGAAGYIGSHTALVLVESGYEVVCVDNFANSLQDSDGGAVSLKRVAKITGKDVPFMCVDCCKEEQLEVAFKEHKIDAVIHFASLKAVGESVKRPLDYYDNNLTATLVLLKLCKKYGVRNFVFSSSATVYGEPERLPMSETDSTGVGITNPYGRTKFMIERILRDVSTSEKDWNIVMLRYFNPVGAHPSGLIGEDPKGVPKNLMPYASQVCIGKLQCLTIFGDNYATKDGTGVRDYIHVMDLARGHVATLDRIKREGKIGLEIYNLGTGVGYSVLDMIAALEKASGRKIAAKVGPSRSGDLAAFYCNPQLAAEKLGWKAVYGLDEMCRDLWTWQTKNPGGYASS